MEHPLIHKTLEKDNLVSHVRLVKMVNRIKRMKCEIEISNDGKGIKP